MADCSYARCVQERRFIRRELSKWTKSMVFIVGEFNKHLFHIILFTYLSIYLHIIPIYNCIYVPSVFIEETYVFSLLLHFLSSPTIYLSRPSHRIYAAYNRNASFCDWNCNRMNCECYVICIAYTYLFFIPFILNSVIEFLCHFHNPPPIQTNAILEQGKETRVGSDVSFNLNNCVTELLFVFN